ncbi:guanine deaminase isoform X2 [Leptinotarsa decemlineata]|uniref:guanine deaminase isoform X2 n=1 Tax=Leptinotarsa decemlineata TaxID=7539 RepID=UPI003D307E4C
MALENAEVIIGNIIHCTGRFELQLMEKAFVIFQGSEILAVGEISALAETKIKLNLKDVKETILKDSQLLIPGLIDTHIHAPQYPNCGLGYDKPLMEWLDTYTYKLEKKYTDLNFSEIVFDHLVRKNLDNGTTTACYFGVLFNDATKILVDSVKKYGQRALIGKINMTTLAPEDYLETPEESITNTLNFIEYVESIGSDLVKPIITPRFALSVEMDLMKKLGQIAKEKNLHIQTHISENTVEVDMVKSKYQMPYANVYDEADLLTPKTILAHGIYLTDEELELIAERGSSISHCPSSNTCLKSGLCDVKRISKFGIKVGLGTALSLDRLIGNFQAGKQFDALIIDLNVPDCTDYLIDCSPLELLQKFIYTGDDRNILNVYVAGKKIK